MVDILIKRKWFVAVVAYILGPLGVFPLFELAGAFPTFPRSSVKNLKDICEATGADNCDHAVSHALYNSKTQVDCTKIADLGDRRPLSEASPDEVPIFGKVGYTEIDSVYATASNVGCECVVVTAAHAFFYENGVKVTDGGKIGKAVFNRGNNVYAFTDVTLGTQYPLATQNMYQDWAVITLDTRGPKAAQKSLNVQPLKVPPDNLPIKDLDSQNLISVGAGISPKTGKYAHTLFEVHIGGGKQNTPVATIDNYNYSIPVRGKFREAIIRACDNCTGSKAWRKDFLLGAE